jgi:CheY-like chemotaxis protein
VRAAEDAAPYRLLGDEPYLGAGDPFGFDEIGSELAQLILRSRESTPFTVGIEATWGRGKSSLMGQLRRRLTPAEQPKSSLLDRLRRRLGRRSRSPGTADGEVEIRTVSYNAWTAEGADVLEGLIKAVLDAIDPSIVRKAMRNEKLWALARVGTVTLASVLRLGDLADRVWNTLSVDARARNQVNDVIRTAMDDWRRRLVRQTGSPASDRLLVVFIDDLDRCSPETVFKIFEAIKLYLDSPGFVFVVGYDENIISEAILHEKRYSERVTGRDYVEKIVQIVFRIPQPDVDQMKMLMTGYLGDSGTTELFHEAERQLVIERNARNPRRIKRFVNRFILDYRLDDASAELKAELLIKLLILETYFPDFARLFDDPSKKNPIAEFLLYREARRLLRQGSVDADPVVELFAVYEEEPPNEAAEALRRLDELVPEPFVRLVREPDFISLLATLTRTDDQEEILRKVQKREELGTRAVEYAVGLGGSKAAPGADEPAPWLAGARIVWVDDRPERNAQVTEWLSGAGAEVYQALGSSDAEELVRSAPDLLISDIGRGTEPYDQEIGFQDLARFRNEGIYNGPAVFYTSRVTQARRQRAAELDAEIASTEPELRRLVGEALRNRGMPEAQAAA